MKTDKPTAAATPACRIVVDSSVRLWGLTGNQRLERQLRALGAGPVATGVPAASDGPQLLLRADFLFDDRVLREMLDSPATLLCAVGADGRSRPVAAHVRAGEVAQARAVLEGTAAIDSLAGVTVRDSASLRATYSAKLLRANQPLVLAVSAERAAALERYMFDASYKGVTDVVTKFLWPTPARWTTRLCANLGIPPNAVTALSLVLVVVAFEMFAEGRFATGLAAAWLMTFLDTVDGKLARVTVASSKFGHLFDHGIDLVHPPLWYVAWACGVIGGWANLSLLDPALVAIFAGYLGGRIVEGLFTHRVGKFSIFTWQPFDSFFRLVTGRRNPNLVLLTVFTVVGLPAQGLMAVAAWTMVSTVVLWVRLIQAMSAKSRLGKLRPWLEELDGNEARVPRYARPFIVDPGQAARLAR